MDQARYVRNRNGSVYHRVGCTRAGLVLPWAWADGMTPDDIHGELGQKGLAYAVRPCSYCIPRRLVTGD